ncbi:MAG: DNA-deoxyinosine glycosylase [Methanospirillum sp.]
MAEPPGTEGGRLPGLGIETGADPVVLVLGSFPSVIARRERAYYANPQNHFWPIVEVLFGIPRTLPYRERVAALNERGVALWDTVSACRQEGSMDHTIRDPELVDVAGWLNSHPSVSLVAVNGRTAERFLKRALRGHSVAPSVRIEILPSTSPANAGTRFEEKVRRWSVLRGFARTPLTRSSRS